MGVVTPLVVDGDEAPTGSLNGWWYSVYMLLGANDDLCTVDSVIGHEEVLLSHTEGLLDGQFGVSSLKS